MRWLAHANRGKVFLSDMATLSSAHPVFSCCQSRVRAIRFDVPELGLQDGLYPYYRMGTWPSFLVNYAAGRLDPAGNCARGHRQGLGRWHDELTTKE
jgi:hypothetical protein